MKKLLSLFFVLALVFSLSSCAIDKLVEDGLDHAIDGILSEAAENASRSSEIPASDPAETETQADETDSAAEALTEQTDNRTGETTEAQTGLDEDGSYDSKDDVALYIRTFGHLPPNYITKKEAERLGWNGGSLEKYAPGKCIGGSHFGNYEGKLPDKKGREWTECDIDTLGASSRGAKRIVFSNDGLIYYTGDHYESFTLLYGAED